LGADGGLGRLETALVVVGAHMRSLACVHVDWEEKVIQRRRLHTLLVCRMLRESDFGFQLRHKSLHTGDHTHKCTVMLMVPCCCLETGEELARGYQVPANSLLHLDQKLLWRLWCSFGFARSFLGISEANAN